MTGHGANNPARLRNFREWIRRLARWVATFEKAGDGSGAGGFDKNSFVGGQPSLGFENLVVGDDVDGAARITHSFARRFPTCWVPNSNRRGNCFRLFDDAAKENRRGPGCLKTDHRRKRPGFSRVAVFAITCPVRGDVSRVTERKKMEIGRVAEIVDNFEGRRFLSGD